MWEGSGRTLRFWYIDLQEPLRRTPLGFDTMDHLLDVVVSPDRLEWHWKDEDEFAEALALGRFSVEEASAIRAEGRRALQRLQDGAPPFAPAWESWRPPTDWPIPALPADWHQPPVE